jgi:hypothetical protein
MLDDQGSPTAATTSEPAADTAAKSSSDGDAPSAPAGATATATATTTETEAPPTVRKINGPAAEPVDLAGVAGPAVIKRVLPLVLALLVVVLILRRRK